MKESVLTFCWISQVCLLAAAIFGEAAFQLENIWVIILIVGSVVFGSLYQIGDSKELSTKIKTFKAQMEKAQANAK